MGVAARRTALLAAVPFAMAILFWWIHPTLAFDADSPRYLAGSPMRTATYPLFLDAAYGPALLPIQLLLFAAALSWLAAYSAKFVPWIISATLVVAIGANPYLWQLQGTVMSEALTTPLLTVMAGCILGFAASQNRGPIIAAALLGGLATTIRPPLLPFILALLCAAWISPRPGGRLKLSAMILVAWATPVAAERLYSSAVHGSELTSPLGRNMFMKAAIIDAPTTKVRSGDALDRRLVDALNHDFEPARRTIHKATDRNVRYILMTNYESCAGYPCANSIVAGFRLSEAQIHRHLLRVGLNRLASNPLGYVELAATEYHRMWLLHPRKHPDLAPKYNAFLAREAPLPFQPLLGVEGQPTPAAEQKAILRLQRTGFAAIGTLAALMSIGFVFWRGGTLIRAAFSLLLGSQAVLVFSTFVGVGLPRYAMGVWPTIIAGVMLGTAGILDLWKSRLDARKQVGTPEQRGLGRMGGA